MRPPPGPRLQRLCFPPLAASNISSAFGCHLDFVVLAFRTAPRRPVWGAVATDGSLKVGEDGNVRVAVGLWEGVAPFERGAIRKARTTKSKWQPKALEMFDAASGGKHRR